MSITGIVRSTAWTAPILLAACITHIGPGGQLAPREGIRSICYVEIRNAAGVRLEVTYTVQNPGGSGRHRLGALEPGRSRTVTADCGTMVQAQGTSESYQTSGSAVASGIGDSVIALR